MQNILRFRSADGWFHDGDGIPDLKSVSTSLYRTAVDSPNFTFIDQVDGHDAARFEFHHVAELHGSVALEIRIPVAAQRPGFRRRIRLAV